MKYVDPGLVAQKVVQGMYNGVSTSELDNLAAETAAYMNIDHPDYAKLAARVSVSNLHKETHASFAETMRQLYEWVDPATGHHAGFISDELWAIIQVGRSVGRSVGWDDTGSIGRRRRWTVCHVRASLHTRRTGARAAARRGDPARARLLL